MIDQSTMGAAIRRIGKDRAGQIAKELEKSGLKGAVLVQAFMRRTIATPDMGGLFPAPGPSTAGPSTTGPVTGIPTGPPPGTLMSDYFVPQPPSGPQPTMPTGLAPPEIPPAPSTSEPPKGLPPDSAIPPPSPELRARIEQLARAHPVPPPQAAPRQPQTTPQADPLQPRQPTAFAATPTPQAPQGPRMRPPERRR